MIREHDCVVLTQNLPDEVLQAGDVGTVVHIHSGGTAYEVEFLTLTGQTAAVATVLAMQLKVRPRPRDRWHSGTHRFPREISHEGNVIWQTQKLRRVRR